jgi:hypothetical protein
MYQSDLERHLFAPSSRLGRRRLRRSSQVSLVDRLRDWLVTGWTRWKELAEAAYL